MLLPEIWELFAYWEEYPPVHVILAGRYLDPERSKRGQPNRVEGKLLTLPAKQTFDNLPLAVQAAILKTKEANA